MKINEWIGRRHCTQFGCQISEIRRIGIRSSIFRIFIIWVAEGHFQIQNHTVFFFLNLFQFSNYFVFSRIVFSDFWFSEKERSFLIEITSTLISRIIRISVRLIILQPIFYPDRCHLNYWHDCDPNESDINLQNILHIYRVSKQAENWSSKLSRCWCILYSYNQTILISRLSIFH